MNNSNKTIITLILILISIPFSYFTYTLSEKEYKSPNNVDKYITIESVQYIPNGRERASCQMVCRDNKGIEYHIIDGDRHFVGDLYQYSEYHGRFYIYIMSIGIIFMLLLMLIFVLIIIYMIILSILGKSL